MDKLSPARHGIPDFVGIDDDPINNMISKLMIQAVFPEAGVAFFTDPEMGLAYLLSTYADPGTNQAILLLDINMPILSGWEVLEALTIKFKSAAMPDIRIYMLSSSVDHRDIQKSKEHPYVSGYIEKPITIEHIRLIVA